MRARSSPGMVAISARLGLRRQRGRNAVRIDGRIVDALGFEKDLMAVAVGEADDLVLDRRTIARAAAGDRAGIDGGAMRIRPHDAMGLGGGAGDVAGKLTARRSPRVSEEKNSGGSSPCWTSSASQSIVARSSRGGVPVFSRAEREAGRVEALRQRDRGRVAEPAGRRALVAEMDHAAQERAGGEDDGAAGERAAVGEFDPADRARLGEDARGFAFDDGQIRRLRDQAPASRADRASGRPGRAGPVRPDPCGD